MAYNAVEITGSTPTGADIAVDEIGGRALQRVKPAFGVEGVAVDVSASNPLPVTIANDELAVTGPVSLTGDAGTFDASGRVYRYAATTYDLALASTPTDFFRFFMSSSGSMAWVRRIEVTAIADAAAVVNILLRKTSNEVSTTGSTAVTKVLYDQNQPLSAASVYSRTSNPSAPSSSEVIRADKLQIGTTTAIGNKVVWEFSPGYALKDIFTHIQISGGGAAFPANTLATVHIEWEEQINNPLIMSGDSTTSNATRLFNTLKATPGILRTFNIQNFGNNGVPLVDAIANNGEGTGGAIYPIGRADGVGVNTVTTTLPETHAVGIAGTVVFCWGINDVRQGACSLATLISRIDTALTLIKTARPDCRIILWGPNYLTTDDYGAHGYVTTTGIFSGMTLAQAAQAATDILYNAYASFDGDSRVSVVLQKQDVFGRTCTTVANSGGLMQDQLHPSPLGEVRSVEQLLPYIWPA